MKDGPNPIGPDTVSQAIRETRRVSAMSDRELAEYQAHLSASVAKNLSELVSVLRSLKIPSWLKRG